MLGSNRFGFYGNKPPIKKYPPTPDTFLAATSGNYPYINVYEWRGDSGFGPRYANAASIVNVGYGTEIDVSPDGTVIVLGGRDSPYIAAYQFDPATGFGNTYSNPSVLPNGTCYALKFNNAGNAIAFGQSTTGQPVSPQNIIVYRWNNSTGFGTKYNNLPGTHIFTVTDIDFAPDDSAIAFTLGGSNYIVAFTWNNTTGFGTIKSGPGIRPTNSARCVKFNNAQSVVAVGALSSPYIFMYAWNGNFSTKFADSTTLPVGDVSGVDFTPGDDAVVVGFQNSPYVAAYAWNNTTGFGARWANPTSLPGAASFDVTISPDGGQVVLASANSGLTGYKLDVSQPTNLSHQALAYKFTSPSGTGFVESVKFGKKQ